MAVDFFHRDLWILSGPGQRQLSSVPALVFSSLCWVVTVNLAPDVFSLFFFVLQAACDELKSCRLFLKLLDAVLKTGNRMNVGTNRGQARAFKLDTLLKLVDVKGTDGKTTLLHFVVREILRSEVGGAAEADPPSTGGNESDLRQRGLKMVAGLSKELANVKKAAAMDSEVLSGYLSKLESGLEKIRLVLQLGRTASSQGSFFEMMRVFLKEAEEEIQRVKSEEKRVLRLVKEITGYFHGDTMKEEAHPFRIFMIVRDFLLVLDRVCREIEGMKAERSTPGAPISAVNRFRPRADDTSDEDSSSSS